MYRSAPYDVQSVGAQSHQQYSDIGSGGGFSGVHGRVNGLGHQYRSSGIPQGASAAPDDSAEAYISRTLYICKLPPDFTEAQISEVLSPFGDIRKITCYPSRQIAFAEYWDLRDAQKARNGLKDVQIGGRQVEIQYSKTRDDRSKEKNTGTLYVRPITTERNFRDPNTLQQYKDLFNRYGEVKKVNTNRKREAEKFIEYHDLRSAEAALEALNGMDFNGVKLEVQFANQSSKTMSVYFSNKEGMVSDGPLMGPARSHHLRRDPASTYGPVRGGGDGVRGGPSLVPGSGMGYSGGPPATGGYWMGPPIKMHWSGTHGPRAVIAAAAAMASSASPAVLATGGSETPSDSAKNRADSAVMTETMPNPMAMLRGQGGGGAGGGPPTGGPTHHSEQHRQHQGVPSSSSSSVSMARGAGSGALASGGPVRLLTQPQPHGVSAGVSGGLMSHLQQQPSTPMGGPTGSGSNGNPNVVSYSTGGTPPPMSSSLPPSLCFGTSSAPSGMSSLSHC